MAYSVTFNLNGASKTVSVNDLNMPLLWVLRDIIGLTGTKYGCGGEYCGACTVLVDGVRQHSCVYNVGNLKSTSRVITVEGLAADLDGAKVQKAWIDNQVPQCGYCQPGMQMVTAGSMKAGHHGKEIESDLTHICVCGTYPRIRDAVSKL